MNENNTSIKEIVEFGLENIEADRTVSVNLRDLVYIHKVLQEYVRFLHQPLHYQRLSDITFFLNDKKSGGALEVLWTAVYTKSDNMLPSDVQELFDNGKLSHPKFPSYYNQED